MCRRARRALAVDPADPLRMTFTCPRAREFAVAFSGHGAFGSIARQCRQMQVTCWPAATTTLPSTTTTVPATSTTTTTTSTTSTTLGDFIVTFPDPNLEAAVRQAIGKPAGDIYRSEVLALTYLVAYGPNVADLSGLEYCTNLTQLRLSSNQISDVAPLVDNPGIGGGDVVHLTSNPLSSDSINIYIPVLVSRGATVYS